VKKIIYLGFEKSQGSVTHDILRYINILTYLLTYLRSRRLEPLLDGGEYKLITTTTFDREETARYLAELTCRDAGSPSLSTTATIAVTVADINDHSPRLPSDVIGVSLVENNQPRTVLTTINATDQDEGLNAQLRYSLAPVDAGSDGVLMIDPLTGVVSTNRTFDYEQVSYVGHIIHRVFEM